MGTLAKLRAAAAFIATLAFASNSFAQIVVNDDAAGNGGEPPPCNVAPDWTTIQDGVDNAIAGDTVLVCPGVYTEDLTIYTNNLNLEGVDRATTVIEGATTHGLAPAFPFCDGPPIDLQANGVRIHNFMISTPLTSSDERTCGLIVDGTDNEIDDNDFEVGIGSFVSVAIQTWVNGSQGLGDISGLYIHDNTVTNLPSLDGDDQFIAMFISPQNEDEDSDNDVVIESNELSGEIFFGIAVARGNTEVADNDVDGAAAGILLDIPGGEEGEAISVHNNGIHHGTYAGILITSDYNLVVHNTTHHIEGDGVEVSGDNNTFTGNNSHHNALCAYDDQGTDNMFSMSNPDRNKAQHNGENLIPSEPCELPD